MTSVLTTHVGSLPFLHKKKALHYTFKFDLPVLFSLPRLCETQFMGKDIVAQLGIGDYQKNHRIKLKQDFYLSNKELRPAYLECFLKELKLSKKSEFKYQLMGPVSFCKLLESENIDRGRALEFLGIKYKSLINRLTRDFDLLFVLDEPLLSEADDEEIKKLNAFVDELSQADSCSVGVHICSKLSLKKINSLNTKLLNLDLSLYNAQEVTTLYSHNFLGLKDGSLQVDWDIEKMKLGRKNYISPSCGLFSKDIKSLADIFDNLVDSKSTLKRAKLHM